MSEVVFITGTGTGVGKTVLTALLLHCLRGEGRRALAMKPFCSGGRGDARLLLSLQKGDVTLDAINPFYFPKPLAPWVATNHGKVEAHSELTMPRVLQPLNVLKKQCDTLLVEGSGGIFVPLSPAILVADFMAKVADRVIVVAPNALGTINHTLLTIEALRARDIKSISVVLVAQKSPDLSAASNLATLAHFLPGVQIVSLPYLGEKASLVSTVKRNAKALREPLGRLAGL